MERPTLKCFSIQEFYKRDYFGNTSNINAKYSLFWFYDSILVSECNSVPSSNIEVKINHSQVVRKPSGRYSWWRLFWWSWRLQVHEFTTNGLHHECFPWQKGYVGNIFFNFYWCDLWLLTSTMRITMRYQYILCHWALSLPTENIRKPLVFWSLLEV